MAGCGFLSAAALLTLSSPWDSCPSSASGVMETGDPGGSGEEQGAPELSEQSKWSISPEQPDQVQSVKSSHRQRWAFWSLSFLKG